MTNIFPETQAENEAREVLIVALVDDTVCMLESDRAMLSSIARDGFKGWNNCTDDELIRAAEDADLLWKTEVMHAFILLKGDDDSVAQWAESLGIDMEKQSETGKHWLRQFYSNTQSRK